MFGVNMDIKVESYILEYPEFTQVSEQALIIQPIGIHTFQ